MPKTIDEGVYESEQRLEAEREIKARFPDAYLEDIDGEGAWHWVSAKAKDECTDIAIFVFKDSILGKETWIVPFLMINGMRLFAARPYRRPLWAIISTIKSNSPDCFLTLLSAATYVGVSSVIRSKDE